MEDSTSLSVSGGVSIPPVAVQPAPTLQSTQSAEQTYVGLDLGDTCSRLFYTTLDQSERGVSDPRPVLFDGNPGLLSLVIFKPGGGETFIRKSDVLSLAKQTTQGQSFESGFKYRLPSGEARSSRAVQVLAGRCLEELKADLNLSVVDFSQNLVTIGVPPEWAEAPATVQTLLGAVEQAGYAGVQIVADAAAAVAYHVFDGNLPIEDRFQSWLVIDVGGKSTRFTAIQKSAGTLDLQVANAFQVDWGGDQIDDVLYERILLPRYWQKPTPPVLTEKTILLLLVRDLKEQLSGQINEDLQSAHSNFQMEGIGERVEFSQPIFESSEVCQPLIAGFEQSLQDERLEQSPAFQDVERVVVVGGSANWYFVRRAIADRWGEEKLVIARQPELTVARGLALAQAGFQPPKPKMEIVVTEAGEGTSPQSTGEATTATPPPPENPQFLIKKRLMGIHRISRSLVVKCVIGGAVLALLVSPIPCISWPFLMAVEIYMFYKLTRFYNYNAQDKIFILLIVGLLGISAILSAVVGLIVEMFPIINIALKPLIAAGVIYGLGEGAIYALDQQSARDGYRNFLKANP